MNQTNLAFAPALELARLIRNKEISPLEITQLYLDRIEKYNSKLGSYFTVSAELAIADARAKTEELTKSDPLERPPFFGVPTAIKDLNPVAGVARCSGVAALQNKIEERDDGIVTRIKEAGFTILGKTATSQVGSLPYTEPPGFPPARNPWNPDYTPGGSSGGAAAAVAAGLCAIAQGSDGGGSVRGPAFCCGLVGIKPSRGRISYAPMGDCLSGIATNGILARTVADAAAMLDAISGYVTGDPYWLPDPDPSFLASATNSNSDRLRIAFSTAIPPVGEADSTCARPVENTAQLLDSLGHYVKPACPDFSGLIEPFITVWQASVNYSGIPAPLLEPMNQWLLERGNAVSSGKYLEAVSKMQIAAREVVAFFENFDILVLPVYLQSAVRVGEWAALSPEETLEKIINWVAPCPPFNASGQPAIALPVGFESGLPVGVQLVGRPAAESTLFALAAELEAANPWIQHRPDLVI
ncbi:MAG: amidase [Oscillatoria sp. SIO1A7]|nr:amidase [Oscillatoria sp. SIO1A7]